ncbi:MAG: ATP-binding cassette domain-containing protein [Actinomycetota bacterium]|nr:ABC-F family ATP-binding cassette domain-containing protein [Euzebyales bacterium]MDQ3326769.1 ATP-binding cassette domain-containing protein [Actinomycetota bacterium]MDQ3528646.1 ATP-binding cassette domain-containing protein [Actinomycetota bacterium]
MNIVGLERVGLRYAEKQVLDEVSLGIDDRDRMGVIGRNGSGKSTLLKVAAGLVAPDTGRVVHGSGLRIRYVAQEPDLDPSRSVREAVLAGPAQFDPLADRAAVQREQRCLALLHQLGLDEPQRRVGELSGGQRKRVALAAALADESDLLVLDEPTNHLDVDVVEWLESELSSRATALLLVTHDRYLLDRVATRIVEVDGGQLHSGHGSYADYLRSRALRVEQSVANERRRANQARVELAWLQRGPQARTSKARYRVERAHELLDTGPAPAADEIAIELPSRRLGSKVVNLHNAGKRYGQRVVLRGVERRLKPGDRIGVVGPNGSGKTTLLQLIAGELEPDTGKVVIGDTVAVGWYGQDPRPVPGDQRVLDAVTEVVLETRLLSGRTVSAGMLLERFGFPSEAQRAFVGELSGGERRRLELLLVLAEAPNVLLLDEPTNDLDLDTLAVLEEYLDDWPGVLVVASHDRYFLDRVCSDLLAIEADGDVHHHPGGWTAWRRSQAERDRQTRRRQRQGSASPANAPPSTATARERKLTYGERRELTRLERRIPELEERKTALTNALQGAGDDYAAARASGDQLTALLAELAAAEARWLELAELADAG